MPKKTLKTAIEKASAEFAQAIIKAVKGASLRELIEIQEEKPQKKRGRKARKKPGPKPKRKKPGPKPKRRKPGPRPKKKTATKKKRTARRKKTAQKAAE